MVIVSKNTIKEETSGDEESKALCRREIEWESASQTPRSMPNSVVETPKTKETAMVLPFVKKSPCWKVFESMEILKAVEQRPHFSHSVYISVHC
ncbi:DUF724 domain-containing protein 5-like isoform X2 [Raphanus sativus]|uniref:DUF724 domain-containing protein 5-like isoform X2 n=1 Tax=Raphanus sativus TaxID=3726 RepID=A0A9W3DA37_RAPSA|nr:DUF724 domain-containing protein 5-like isoform X2 [Raphanus sativus]